MIRHRLTAALTVGICGFALACTNQLPTFAEEGEILAIQITNACRAIETGNTCTIRATAFAEGGVEVPSPLLFWSTSSPQILTVESPAGERTIAIVRGVSGGTATVTVANGEQTVTSSTTVRVQSTGGGGDGECDEGGRACP